MPVLVSNYFFTNSLLTIRLQCRQKGLQSALDKVIKDKEELTKMLTMAIEDYGNYKGRDENPPKKKAVDKATEAIARKKESFKSLVAQVFQLYSHLLTEEARRPWWKIDVTPGATYVESNTLQSIIGPGSPS